MPNFKIIQDMPDQARVKIYGINNIALNQDTSGSLAITNMGNPLSITTASGQALAITTLAGQELAITNSGNPLSITTASGQALAITTLAGQPLAVVESLAVSDVTYQTGNFTGSALTTPDQNVLSLSRWSWICYNTSSDATAIATVKMQGSPDEVAWLDNSSLVTLSQFDVTALVPSFFLKYQRVYYSSGTTAASLNIYFQAQG